MSADTARIQPTADAGRDKLLTFPVGLGLVAGTVSAPLFILVDLLDGLTRPDYSVLRHWVSHRGLGDLGWIGAASLAAVATLLALDGLGLLLLRRRAHIRSLYPAMVTTAATALLFAGLFPMDPSLGYPPASVPPETPSPSGTIHDIAGPTFIVALALASTLTPRYLERVHHPARWSWLGRPVTGVILLAFAATTVLVSLDYAGVVPGAWSGFFERIAIYAGLAWNSAVSLHILCERPRPAAA